MTRGSHLPGAALASAAAVALGVLAAWPIYQTLWLFAVAVAGLIIGIGLGVAVAALARRWPPPALAAVVIGIFALTVVPVAMPESVERLSGGSLASIVPGLASALGDGLAAVVLGWKQLLTLTLPVGSYQTVLVPAYLVFLLTGLLVVAMRNSRFAPFAAAPLLAPVAFGTVFGGSELSAPIELPGIGTVAAPRELSLWLAAALLGAAWVAWASGAEHRAALRRLTPSRRGRAGAHAMRATLAVAVIMVAALVGLMFAPLAGSNEREVPRDRVDPEVVLREQPSPLAGYRLFKRDDALDTPLFSVDAPGELPPRLRLAVLDAYDGVDFHVGAGSGAAGTTYGTAESGRFTRFPSAGSVDQPVEVTLLVDEGYNDIWVPTAGLGSLPVFSGPRADALADAFYVNRATGGAIVVPVASEGKGRGLESGDGYRATMSAAPDLVLTGRPAVDSAQLDLEAMPELAEWVRAQGQPATGEGLGELIHRLRARGYMSHALTEGDGDRLWVSRLAERYGTSFWPSAGGHSAARIEQLFGQLNAQERRVGADSTGSAARLVAGVGDDEQFAVAAALVARALGFDSRVVLGVRLETADPVPGIPNCTDACTGENLAAWVEVRGAEGVWVPIDATPQLEQRPSTLEEGEQLPEYPTTPEERDAQEVDPPIGVGDPDQSAGDSDSPSVQGWLLPLLRAAALSVLALLFLAIPLLFLPLAKRSRTNRRREEPDPELRALGAWQEMVDGILDAGAGAEDPFRAGGAGGLLSRGSRQEIASAAGAMLDEGGGSRGDRVRRVAAIVDRAVFSAEGITDAEADGLWEEVEADLADHRASLGFWRRLRARYSLRSYGVRLAVLWPGAKESRRREDKRRIVDGRRMPVRTGGRN